MMKVVNKSKNESKLKKGLMMLTIIIGILVVIEVIALVWLATSVGRYRDFWVTKAKEPGQITYVALGDSAAQAIGASSPMKGYVGLIAKHIEEKTGKSVKVINVSKTGAKMEDYLNDQASIFSTVKPDIVTIEIGANDVANFDADYFRATFTSVLNSLPDGSLVSNMPLFNSRPGSTANGSRASEIIEEELSKYPRLVFVDLQQETEQNQSIFGFAPDLFHPNNMSYKNWANAFINQIENKEF